MQFLDSFVKSNLTKLLTEDEFLLVVIYSLDQEYQDISKLPMQSISNTPFAGKSAEECSAMLQELVRETHSNINFETFAIIDQRSLDDGTVLLVTDSKELRAVQALASVTLSALAIGHIMLDELEKDAEDGVLRS